jgi:hypothetical protein
VSTPLDRAAGPGRRWVIGPVALSRSGRGRWGCNWRNSIGVANYAGPLGALLGLRRALRSDARRGPAGRVTR